ncbi:hypothetical protein SAY87_023881 [Trapa incisa]|uniref:ARMC9 CTLH-like domain-containing protein n=1 Tax=Trapa incisa TaxID=236973 RepID=A0AAN7KZL6_9MYRT|nr:hypothetical protein SAY87_023881 [Trapa incisa]
MENMQYAEDLVRESLLFRGFTNTLLAFEAELGTDVGKEFQVDKLLELIFSMYIPGFQADNLVGLLNFFKQLFSPSTSETVLVATLSKLEISILRCYIVHAIRSGKRDKVIDLFNMFGNDLLQKGQEWTPWFAIPYAKNPSSDPEFCIYFTKAWYEALQLLVRNFFNEIFNYSYILLSELRAFMFLVCMEPLLLVRKLKRVSSITFLIQINIDLTELYE